MQFMMQLKEATGQMPRLIGAVLNPQVQAEQITTFNSSGTFTAQPLSITADILVVAGGGAGGGELGAGGGAGGYREISSHPIPASPFPITVGAGASGAPNTAGASGNSSILGAASPITSNGGGGGGAVSGGPGDAASNGGSGGGAGVIAPATGYGAGNTPPTSPSQGNRGGGGTGSAYGVAGGGGGASAVGVDGSNAPPQPATAGDGGA